MNKYAEDIKLIHCDYHFNSDYWKGPVYDSDHGGIIGIYDVGSHYFRYGFVVSCSLIKSFLYNNFTILNQLRSNSFILYYDFLHTKKFIF